MEKEYISFLLSKIKKDTFHMGATGCVVQSIKFVMKRILLYSLVAHIPEH